MNRKLTLQQLVNAGACPSALDEFRRRFGAEVAVTARTAVAVAGVFDFDWAAYCLLSAPARAARDKAIALARAAYDKATATAWAAYDKATATAWAAYDKAIARAFAHAYNEDKP